MPPPRRVIINGKFLAAELTGVHRVAGELIRHSYDLLRKEPGLAARLVLELWVPAQAAPHAAALDVPYRVLGPLQGVPWEQLTLPFQAHGATILSLCNVGPLATRNAVTMLQDAQVHATPRSYRRSFRAWYRLNQPIVGHRHRHILTVSEFSREELVRHGLATRDHISVILNGADHTRRDRPDDLVLDRLALRSSPYVVALANTQPHKNIGLLLRAFADERLKSHQLVLFGAATRARFEEAGHAVPDNVRFAGRVTDSELWALYRGATCLAFPSLTEGFGLPPLEAMSMECPVIAAPTGALPQTCGSAALYADPARPEEWVNGILALGKDKAKRRAILDAGLSWSARFRWKDAASQLVAALLAL